MTATMDLLKLLADGKPRNFPALVAESGLSERIVRNFLIASCSRKFMETMYCITAAGVERSTFVPVAKMDLFEQRRKHAEYTAKFRAAQRIKKALAAAETKEQRKKEVEAERVARAAREKTVVRIDTKPIVESALRSRPALESAWGAR